MSAENVILVTIRDKVATADKTVYVCGNSGFTVDFDFDSEWDEFKTKTARFVCDDASYVDVLFDGKVCPVPILSNTHRVRVGVYAGNLVTTTPAYITASKSILCDGGTPADPPDDVYNQLMEKLNQGGGGGGGTGPQGPQGEPGYTPVKYIDYWTEEDKAEIVDDVIESLPEFGEDTEERLKTLEDQMADLMYTAISITSFSHNAGTKEMGDTVTSVTLSWAINKKPTSLTLDGSAIDVSLTSKALTGLNITSGKTWTLAATDERNASSSKATAVSFQNGIYYGAKAAPATIDSNFIKGLGKKELSGTKNRTVTVNGGDGLYFWYAYPKRLGTSLFNIGGFDYEYGLETVSFTNQFGYTEDYYVYRSGQYAPASLSVTVKNGG